MKTITLVCILLAAPLQLMGQGTVRMSNIGKPPVKNFFGEIAQVGTSVSLVIEPSLVPVGPEIPILGAGFFSAGDVVLDGIAPRQNVTLRLWVKREAVQNFSDPFQVTLGDPLDPAFPAASIPDAAFASLPEPSTIRFLMVGAVLMFGRLVLRSRKNL